MTTHTPKGPFFPVALGFAVCLMWSAETIEAKDHHAIVSGLEPGLTLADAFAARPDLTELDPPWDFGPLEGKAILKNASIANTPATVFLQLQPGEARIRQILIDMRDDGSVSRDTGEVFASLRTQLGPPDHACHAPATGGGSNIEIARWNGPSHNNPLSATRSSRSGIAVLRPGPRTIRPRPGA